jgi:hypothetical protein
MPVPLTPGTRHVIEDIARASHSSRRPCIPRCRETCPLPRRSAQPGISHRYVPQFCISALYLMFVSPSPLATLSSPGPPHALPVLPPSRPPHALPDRPPLDRPSLALRPSLLSLVLSAPHVRPLLTLLTPAIPGPPTPLFSPRSSLALSVHPGAARHHMTCLGFEGVGRWARRDS